MHWIKRMRSVGIDIPRFVKYNNGNYGPYGRVVSCSQGHGCIYISISFVDKRTRLFGWPNKLLSEITKEEYWAGQVLES